MSDFLEVKNLNKDYDGHSVLSDLNFSVKQGEIFCILGPSGCGKSTLLRALSGLTPSSGEIILNGRDLQHIPIEKREMGLIFQDYSLFPHLNVEKNISFGMREKSRGRVNEWLEVVGLKGKNKKYPHELSGGEQQRVALARALAYGPKLLLLDEPFSNLDFNLRTELRLELKRILKEKNMTAIFITHGQEEAFDIADRIAILNHGRFEQVGTGSELYNFPQTRFTAEFIGSRNFLKGEVSENSIKTVIGPLDRPTSIEKTSSEVKVYIPSSAIRVYSKEREGTHPFEVVQSSFRGDFFAFTLKRESDFLYEIKSKNTPDSLGNVHLLFDRSYLKTFF